MKPLSEDVLKFNSIAELFQRMGLGPLSHPLMALVNYDQSTIDLSDAGSWYELDFYKVTFKEQFTGSVRYGPGNYDFREGGMAFVGPRQSVQKTADLNDYQGYALYFHRDLLQGHPLAQRIHGFGFFAYAVNEALFLSDREKQTMGMLFEAISRELDNHIDRFSDEILVTQLELLLNHSNRFYHRQFFTRRNVNYELITRMNTWLQDRLDQTDPLLSGLPSPQDIAAYLKVSQRYLSDMLKALTGHTTQQHIHLALIEKAKILLNQTTLSTAEIAYRLGFEHPQSFNKLFKKRTQVSPAEYRQNLFPD